MAIKDAPSRTHMTMDQAKEMSHALYPELTHEEAERRAESVQFLTDEYNAHRIISWYMTHAMLSPEGVREYIKEELDLE